MTKNYDPKDVKKKEPSSIAKAAEKFPSPPKKDGSADPENIMAKKRREEAEAARKKRVDEGYQPGFKKGSKKAKEAANKSGGGKKG